MSISNFKEKIKEFVVSEQGKDILIVIIIILVGLGSFELGRLSKSTQNTGIEIEYLKQGQNQPASVISGVEYQDIGDESVIPKKAFFASNRGKKYYSAGCSAGKSIVQENRVYFETREAAEHAGYELSSSCR